MNEEHPAEGKREKFVRLAEARTANALRAIRVIGNLANRAHYEFTDADIKKITSVLNKEVDAAAKKFVDQPSKTKTEFRL